LRKILIPLDGSKFAEQSLTRGLAQFSNEVFQIYLLRCIDLNEPLDYDGEFVPQENLEKERHQKVEAAHEDYLKVKATALEKNGHTVSTRVLTGDPTRLILHTARQEQVDFLIVTSHGRSGLKRLVNGSVAESVARRSPCPVLLIPPVETD